MAQHLLRRSAALFADMMAERQPRATRSADTRTPADILAAIDARLAQPVPLPSLTSALSRRAAIFGAVTVAAVPTVTTPAAAAIADADRRLAAMAAEVCAVLDGAAYAMDEVHDEADQDRRLDRANALTLDMIALPAVGLPGVLAKAKSYLDSASYDVLHLADLTTSLAEDVERVLEARPHPDQQEVEHARAA